MVEGALRTPNLVTAIGTLPKRGRELGEPAEIRDAAIAWSDDRIDYVGPAGDFDGPEPENVEGTIVPGFVDCHTHLPFIGWRSDEFEARLAGKTYRDLHQEGGISRSARMFNEASDDEVVAFCVPLLQEMLSLGTTAVEFKTGYGLSVEAELRQARVARRIADEVKQTCTVTLLPCHAIPKEETKESWVSKACSELIPAAAEQGLADAVDIYVEDIAFDTGDLKAVAQAAADNDLPLRAHVEQLSNLHGAELAAEIGASSVDHLNHVDDAAVNAIGNSSTIAVLLPASTFMLGSSPPPARALIDSNAAVAIATDFNPGTSPVLSMPEVIALACALYKLSPVEALVAATANPASVLGLDHDLGTLEPGKRADFIVLDGTLEDVPYRPGHDPVARTYVGGRRVKV
jgi:imidazolonepropionase